MEKVKNPVKEMACHLAHQMDREREIDESAHMSEREAEWRRLDGKFLREEIYKKGYNVGALLAYADEYKALKSMKEYYEWIYI
jgi:hypothetical protein